MDSYVVMRVGSERYAAHVAQVRSVERVGDITPVPRTLPFIKGVMHLRGAIVPVIDLAERVGLTRAADGDEEDRRIVVAEVDEMAVGMLVDAVEDVVSIAPEAIEPPPSVVGGLEAVYLRGVARWGEHLLVLLNLERVFSAVETEQLRQVEKLVHG